MNIVTNQDNSTLKAIRGQILSFKADPFLSDDPESCIDYFKDGTAVIGNGKIIDVDHTQSIKKRYPDITHTEQYSDDALIMPGFIDCHAHYVQAPMVGSFGETLLDWLNTYTFPTEAMFADKEHAAKTARIFIGQLLANGTTTANVFATTFESSVDAFFEESERAGTRMICGKVLQDRNLPDSLKDKSAEESVETAERLLKRWHGRGRQLYAVIPRFAPTSTPGQLSLAGDLYQRYLQQGVYMHTHLDESEDEIRWVKELFPDAENYTDVYRRFGLLGNRSLLAHCCIVSPAEWELIGKAGASALHCPSSNLFLGDGQFRWWDAVAHNVAFGIGTDIGAGTNFSILRQLGEAYKVGMLHARGIDALRSFYLATRGGARALRLDDRIGSIAPGYEADMTVIDLKPDSFTEWRLQSVTDIFQKLFVLQTLSPAKVIKATYVAGEKVFHSGNGL